MIRTTRTARVTELALEIAKDAARVAGRHLLENRGNAHVQAKKSLHDDLLDVDLLAESIILDKLRTAFPSHAIFSEEAGHSNAGGTYQWIVDPLDGSANYQHDNPMFAIAISLLKGTKTQLCVIYLPTFDEMYTAIRSAGAECNGQPIHVSGTATLAQAVVHVGDFAKTGSHADNSPRVRAVSLLADAAYRVRMIGTAATDFAYLACGRADGLVMYKSHPWDTKAGLLLLEEAGGRSTTIQTSEGAVFSVYSNGHLQAELCKLLRRAM